MNQVLCCSSARSHTGRVFRGLPNHARGSVRRCIVYLAVFRIARTLGQDSSLVYGESDPENPIRLFQTERLVPETAVVGASEPPIWKYRICVLVVLPFVILFVYAAALIFSAVVGPIPKLLVG